MKFWNWLKGLFGLKKEERCECEMCAAEDAEDLGLPVKKKKSKKRK